MINDKRQNVRSDQSSPGLSVSHCHMQLIGVDIYFHKTTSNVVNYY